MLPKTQLIAKLSWLTKNDIWQYDVWQCGNGIMHPQTSGHQIRQNISWKIKYIFWKYYFTWPWSSGSCWKFNITDLQHLSNESQLRTQDNIWSTGHNQSTQRRTSSWYPTLAHAHNLANSKVEALTIVNHRVVANANATRTKLCSFSDRGASSPYTTEDVCFDCSATVKKETLIVAMSVYCNIL